LTGLLHDFGSLLLSFEESLDTLRLLRSLHIYVGKSMKERMLKRSLTMV
jgi:hypothetical protein